MQAIGALQDQLKVRKQREHRLSQFEAQMDEVAATLGVIHAQIIQMDGADEALVQGRVAEQVRTLRRDVDASAHALDDAYDELRQK